MEKQLRSHLFQGELELCDQTILVEWLVVYVLLLGEFSRVENMKTADRAVRTKV